MRISPKALGLLFHMSIHGSSEGAKGLQETFGEGKDYISTGLIELLSNGLIRSIKGRTNSGKFYRGIEITDSGREYVKRYKYHGGKSATAPGRKTRTYIPLNSDIADTPYSIYTNSVNQGTALESAVQEKEEFGGTMDLGAMPIDPDDLEAEKEKDKKRKQEEKKENRRKNYANRQRIRANRPIEKWTPTDVVNYYAEQVKLIWNLEEVRYDQRPAFIRALDEFRSIHDTTGDVEKQLLDMWLDKHKYDTKNSNADMLFFGFIKYAPSMLDEAKRILAPEDLSVVESARERRQRQLGK